MTEDKFIMMNMDDKKSKKIAEVLGSKTCKNILDFLAETKEASEKDISDALQIPINTAEYNLKKLLASGLVVKTKNFFWSPKGRKISMYKLARKHIVISPKSTKPNMNILKTILPVIIAAALLIALIILFPFIEQKGELKSFNSLGEIQDFLKENQEQGNIFATRLFSESVMIESAEAPITGADTSAPKASAADFSETNIQIKGVDEPDIVKNDGKYIYVVTRDKLLIIDAFPVENMKILSEIKLSENIRNIFINENKLVIFSNPNSRTNIYVYDISDKEDPELEQEYSIDGNYRDARMINNYVYIISTKYTSYQQVDLPSYRINKVETLISPRDISYFDMPDSNYIFTSVSSINLDNEKFKTKVFLTGASQNIFVSKENIFLTSTKIISMKTYFNDLVEKVFLPMLPASEKIKIKQILNSDIQEYEKQDQIGMIINDYSNSLSGNKKENFDKELQENMQEFMIELSKKIQRTVIHKISIDKENIEYQSSGEVPGTVLNQFSMDEYDGNFRIATTTGNTWNARDQSLNHLYILDKDLDIIGKVEDLAQGERIYSARFIGKRAYMVTFRQTDPLYVIDLSKPKAPEVLGYLKVTGFSNYLHPYDEDHIIGIGKEATEQGRTQGVKIALFDVSDVENPIEKAKYEVQGEYSESNALYDHKAFLFDKERNLLVLPISYSERTGITPEGYPQHKYWQGAFVFYIDQNKISLREKINHKKDSSEQSYYYSPSAIQRSLFMDNTLYTISRAFIKANNLTNDLEDINSIELPYNDEPVYGILE